MPAVIEAALRWGLLACGCGPADLVAAPRPEGFRPGAAGRPPRRWPTARDPAPALACPSRCVAQYPDALALPCPISANGRTARRAEDAPLKLFVEKVVTGILMGGV